MVNISTQIPDFDSHSPTFGFLSSDPIICPAVAFSALQYSDHVFVSVSVDALQTQMGCSFLSHSLW